MLSKDLARAFDPVMLARDVGIECDPWQADLLRSMHRGWKCAMCCSRQSGKSLCAAIMCLWYALYCPSSLVILASPSQTQSNELLRKIRLMHAKLVGAPELIGDAVQRAEFANASRIIALSGEQKSARGHSADLIVVDECAQVDPELWTALRPSLAVTNGSLVALSTPKGKANIFAELWHSGDPDWTRVRVSADQCPRISKEFLASELKELGPSLYGQEYLLDFLEDTAAAFNFAIIEAAFNDPTVRALWR